MAEKLTGDRTVFVVAHDGGSEGFGEPLAVFETKHLADIFVAGGRCRDEKESVMCTTIYVKGSRDDIHTVDDLAALLGPDMIQIADGYHSDDPNDFKGSCLCPVEIAETMVNAGFRVWLDDADSMRYICERTETAQLQPHEPESAVNEK